MNESTIHFDIQKFFFTHSTISTVCFLLDEDTRLFCRSAHSMRISVMLLRKYFIRSSKLLEMQSYVCSSKPVKARGRQILFSDFFFVVKDIITKRYIATYNVFCHVYVTQSIIINEVRSEQKCNRTKNPFHFLFLRFFFLFVFKEQQNDERTEKFNSKSKITLIFRMNAENEFYL